MFRVVKGLIYLAILGGIGVVGYAYLGDLSPETGIITKSVDLDDL